MTELKKRWLHHLAAAWVLLAFVACVKTNAADLRSTNYDHKAMTNEKINSPKSSNEIDCFQFKFPITVKYPGGKNATYRNEEALFDGIDNFYRKNPKSEEDYTFVYPLKVKKEDGSIVSIANDNAFEKLLDSCGDDFSEEYEEEGGLEECLTYVYPLTLVYPDGTKKRVASDEAYFKAIDKFYDKNHKSDQDITYAFPISIKYVESGKVVSIANEAALDAAYEKCP